jgi:hypothetical protein
MKLKYVMGPYGPVIFPETYVHSDIAKGISGPIKSAGFLYIDWNEKEQRLESKPFGESTSLELKSDPDDNKKIDRFLNDTF